MSKGEIEKILRDIIDAISDIQEIKIVQIANKKTVEKGEKIKKREWLHNKKNGWQIYVEMISMSKINMYLSK